MVLTPELYSPELYSTNEWLRLARGLLVSRMLTFASRTGDGLTPAVPNGKEIPERRYYDWMTIKLTTRGSAFLIKIKTKKSIAKMQEIEQQENKHPTRSHSAFLEG